MARFIPIIRIAVGAGVGVVAVKANQRYGMVIDQDALTAAIMLSLAATNFKGGKKPQKPIPQDAPKS